MKKFLLLTALLSGFFLSEKAHATHIIGAEIRYEYLPNINQYKIILDVYRDCGVGSEGFDAVAFITAFDHNGNYLNMLQLNAVFSGTTDTIPNNISDDPCLLPPDSICVEHTRYMKTAPLNYPNGIYLVYQRCCRNGGTANIVNSLETGSTYFVFVKPEALALHNSSPYFNELPPLFVCVGRDILHDHSATDPDGDSLAYRFYTPYSGASLALPFPDPTEVTEPPYDPVIWETGFSLGNILGTSPGNELTIDPETGLITGYPELMGQFVVGVAVDEYRNGLLMSTIIRDYQYTVGECVQVTASIVAPDAQCDDLTVNFENGTDGPPNFQWYFDWPNPTPSSNLVEPTYTFPDTGKYTVVLIAAPGYDCVDTATQEILLQFNSLTPAFDWQTFDCQNESVLVLTDQSEDYVSPPVAWNWTVIIAGSDTLTSTEQHPVFLIPNPSSGSITLNVLSQNGCDQTKVELFAAGGNNPLDCLPDTVRICIGGAAQLNPVCQTAGFHFQWGAPVPAGQQNLPNPTVTPIVNTIYPVTITTNFSGVSCQTTGQVLVEVSPSVALDFVEDTDCDVREVHFINQSLNAAQGFAWDFGDPTTTADVSSEANPTYFYPATDTYTVMLATAADAICRDTISREITLVEKILDADFSYAFVSCEEGAVAIQFFDETDNSLGNTVAWHWVFSGIYNGTSSQPNPTITVTQEGNLIVSLTVTTDENCQDTSAVKIIPIDLTELPGLDLSDDVLGCLNGGVTLNPGGDTSYTYQWSPGTGLSCTTCPSPHANPSQTTTYSVTVRNISTEDCDISRQVTVFVPQDVNLFAGDDVRTCDENITLSVTATLPITDILWYHETVLVGSGPTLDVIVSGYDDYVATARDQFQCPYFDTVRVVGGPPNIETSGEVIICSDETGDVFALNLDPNDTLAWQWTPTTIFNGPTNVPNPDVMEIPGEEILYVQAINQFDCPALDSVYLAVVDVNNQLSFTHQVGCSGSTVAFTNTSTNAFNYGWDFGDPTTTSDVSTLENPTYTYGQNGTYTVTLTIGFSGLDCVTPFAQQVVISDPVFIPAFDFEYLECTEDSILVQFHDTSINFLNNTNSWAWTTSDGGFSNLPDPVFWVHDGEDFIVTLVISTPGPDGCTDSVTQTLKLDFAVLNLPDTLTLCQGDSTEINPLGSTGYAYLWSPNVDISDPTATNPTVWPAATTTYSVNITTFETDTCYFLREVVVFVPEKIDVTAPGDTLTCGAPVQLLAASNITPTIFTWVNSGGAIVGNQPLLAIYPLFDEIYTVTGTDEYGCTDSEAVAVANESIQASLVAPSVACPEVEIPLSVANSVADHLLSFDWSSNPPGLVLPPANTAAVAAATVGAGLSANYAVVVENQFGCADTLSQNIVTNQFVAVVEEDVFACPGVPTALNPNADPALTYVWVPADSLNSGMMPNPTVTTSVPTVFTVTVSAMFGMEVCSQIFEVVLDVAPVINITETVDTFTCGEAIVLSASTNVGTTLAWFDSQNNQLGTGGTLSVNPSGVEVYTVVATDAFQCTASDMVAVSNNQIDVSLEGQGVVATCPEPSYDLCATNLDPVDVLTFEWSGDIIIAGANGPCVTVTSAIGTVAIFTVNIENQWGCEVEDEVELTTYAFDPIIREIENICPNVPTEINAQAVGSPFSYQWTPEIGLDCYNCPNPTANLDTSQQYIVMVTDVFGPDTCSLTQTVQVNVMPEILLEATATPNGDLCDPGTSVLLAASVGSPFVESYIWSENPDFSSPIGTASEVTVLPNGTVTYYVTAIDTLNCRDSAEVTVDYFPLVVSSPDSLNFCEENGTLIIALENADPAQELTYTWAPEEPIVEYINGGQSVEVDISENTLFTVTVENQFGCTETYEVFVGYFNIGPTVGEITSTEDTIYFNSGEFSQLGIDFAEGYQYEWTPQDGLDDPFIHNPRAEPDETTIYSVIVTDEGGCIAVREDTIVVINPDCDEPYLFLPNAFTPNGDGENDVLYFLSNIVEEMELSIYNRWGQLVFRTTDQGVGWEGSFENKGEPLPPDVFGFYLTAKCFNGMNFSKKGNVTLLR